MDKPLWTDSTIEMLGKYIMPKHIVYEFGSGRSSLWLAKRVSYIYTLESDKGWADFVRLTASEREIKNLMVNLKDITSGDYMRDILSFPDEQFDIVIVDGAFRRVEAFERAIAKTKRGGIIMLDDAQNLSWKGCFFVQGVSVVEQSEPDNSGKQAAIFRRD